MSEFVVTVTFEIPAPQRQAFMQAMLDNAAQSLQREPGCLQFDVCTDPADAGSVFLYEVYTDRAAFDEHLRSAHFLAFDALTRAWVANKSIRLLQRAFPA